MTLMPTFEIGVWNAWVFMLTYLVFNAADPNWLIRGRDFKALFKKSSVMPPFNRTEKRIAILSMPFLFLLLAYSVFVPLPLGTAWFYTGLGIFLLGLIMWEIAGIPWAATRVDEPITRGLYRYSRHPMYIAISLQHAGAGIASASWLLLLLVILYTVLSLALVAAEERFCLEKYGDAYRDYMNVTPRWMGAPRR